MAQLKYCDKHNQVGFLRKPDESAGFAEIVDFLRGSNLRYTISEASIRESLQLEDATGITMLPNDELFEGMGQIGSKSGGWDQFGSNIATALICLSTDSERKNLRSGEEQSRDPLRFFSTRMVASLKTKVIDKGRRYKRRKETKGKKVVSSLDFQEEVDAGAEQVNTAKGVNTGRQREGKAPMLSEETPKKSKEQILQEEASIAKAIRLDSLQKEDGG
ncbi:hypothetical protein Tco_0963767 [Tanacetum coccineum]